MVQRRQEAAECQDATGLVRHRDHPRAHVFARSRIGLGDTAQGLAHRIRARQSPMRPRQAVAGDRDIDQGGIDLFQILIAKAVFLRRAGAEVLPEDIRLSDQIMEDLAALVRLQI